MFDWFESLGLQDLNFFSIALRILLASVFGGALGLERSLKRRAAGFRTYMLVCLSACLVMMTGQYMASRLGGTDPARLGAQVISGIGFLGAGSILITGTRQIKGITTAAGLWSSACLGIAIGIGFYAGALIMFLTMFLVMTIFNFIESKYVGRSKRLLLYAVLESTQGIASFFDVAKQNNVLIDGYETMRSEYPPGIGMFITLRFKERRSHSEVLEIMRPSEGLIYMEEI